MDAQVGAHKASSAESEPDTEAEENAEQVEDGGAGGEVLTAAQIAANRHAPSPPQARCRAGTRWRVSLLVLILPT